ncbi:MAG: hypothetical protein U0930_19285 [Pirellulales bacterium]
MKQTTRSWIITISCLLVSILLTELIVLLDLVPIMLLVPWQGLAAMALVLVAAVALVLGRLKWRGWKLQFSTRLLLLLILIVAWPVSRFTFEARHEKSRLRAQQGCFDMATNFKPLGPSYKVVAAGRYNDGKAGNALQRWLIGQIMQYADPSTWQFEIAYLVSMDFAGTDILDDQLVLIAKTQTVQELNLSSTKITDAGLKHLHDLKTLRQLTLANTNVSNEAVDALSKEIPGLTVAR